MSRGKSAPGIGLRALLRLQDAISIGAASVAAVFARPSPVRFGVREAILFPNAIDVWMRNAAAMRSVMRLVAPPGRLLDIGSGRLGIVAFAPKRAYRIFSLDVSLRPLEIPWLLTGGKVLANAGALPFRNDVFDAVLAIDVIEHIPLPTRRTVFEEMKRVAARIVVLHCPVSSSDGRFVGRDDDLTFQEWHIRMFGAPDKNTEEHIASVHPTVEELSHSFPRARIWGTQDAKFWRTVVRESRLPFLGLVASLRYRKMADREGSPPYHACLLEWEKH